MATNPNPWVVYEIPNSSRVTKLEFQKTRTINRGTIKGIVLGNLRVTYKSNGARYIYYNIPKPVLDEILRADSVGKALQVIISNKDIKYEKLP